MTLYGPMWQAECDDCGWMGSTFDTKYEAKYQLKSHDCITYLTHHVLGHAARDAGFRVVRGTEDEA